MSGNQEFPLSEIEHFLSQSVTANRLSNHAPLVNLFVFSACNPKLFGSADAISKIDGYRTPRPEAKEDTPVRSMGRRRSGGVGRSGGCCIASLAGRSYR